MRIYREVAATPTQTRAVQVGRSFPVIFKSSKPEKKGSRHVRITYPKLQKVWPGKKTTGATQTNVLDMHPDTGLKERLVKLLPPLHQSGSKPQKTKLAWEDRKQQSQDVGIIRRVTASDQQGTDLKTLPRFSRSDQQPSARATQMEAQLSSRPPTGSSRFGNMSLNSFFTRHNPHPGRVRHIKGLNDVPICAVDDDGFFPDARYKLQFPPDVFSQTKVKAASQRLPVNAASINSNMHAQNTLTGLQHFTGMQSYPYRERAVPKLGMVPVTERWREELQALTSAVGLTQAQRPQEPPKRPMYSAETGRLIPPPSRAMSRGASRRGQAFRQYEHITREQDMENNVLQMLCQILQTDDVNAVQAWLISAGDQEKSYVLDLIKSAVATRDEYYRRQPVVIPAIAEAGETQQQATQQPEVNEATEQMVQRIDRLALENMPPRGNEPEDSDVARYTRHAYGDVHPPPRQLPAQTAVPPQQAQMPQPANEPETTQQQPTTEVEQQCEAPMAQEQMSADAALPQTEWNQDQSLPTGEQ